MVIIRDVTILAAGASLMMSRCRLLFLLLLLLGGLPAGASAAPPDEKPRLLVLVVFDQLRGDYLERWGDLFGKDGFHRLERDSAWFQNCHYPYAVTKTGAGHASLATGCSPDHHGIIANQWFDRDTDGLLYCVESKRYTQVPPPARVDKPAPTEKKKDKEEGSDGISPELLKAPTLGDTLKKATGDKSRVVALSFKDRSAVLLGGAHADACYWFDTRSGAFVTSTYYRDRLHPWVEAFNRDRAADAWFGKTWTPLNPKLNYRKLSLPRGSKEAADDEEPFARKLPSFTKQPGSAYYRALYATPFGNDLLLQLARRAIEAEGLGKRDTPDLLCISFSCNDAIGHIWGPDSPEVLDVTLRSDLVIKELLDYLDAQVGKGKYTLALSADHGICPLPETSAELGLKALRVPSTLLSFDADSFLRKTFGKEGDRARWVAGRAEPWVYLNQALIKERGLDAAEVESALAKWYETQPGILKAYTRTQLVKGIPEDDAIGQSVRHAFYADRCGDIAVVLKPYCLFSQALGIGTNHGTPHDYDTHVPLLVMGPGIRKGTYKERVTPQAVVPILASAAGIAPPKECEVKVPVGIKD
jgi:hypothetical protein